MQMFKEDFKKEKQKSASEVNLTKNPLPNKEIIS